jgi:predicted nucleic acid-binding protein
VTRYVVDTTVVIKWLIQEDGTQAAILLRNHPLIAPELLLPECANVLWKKTRRGELTEQEAHAAARLLAYSEIELIPMRPLLEPATRLAIHLDHPAYDCIYLALAERDQCELVTADERLIRKAAANPSVPLVISLGQLEL